MNIAVIGSRNLQIDDLSAYLPPETTAIISGGAKGIDACAKRYAEEHGIPFIEIRPAYARYGRAAPLIRNQEIVMRADYVLAFWDGKSKGTNYVIELCQKLKKPIRIHKI